MPKGDGTGPIGQGPGTGRGRGPCGGGQRKGLSTEPAKGKAEVAAGEDKVRVAVVGGGDAVGVPVKAQLPRL